jgi:hypothetical protein
VNLLVGPAQTDRWAALGRGCDANAPNVLMFRGAFDNGSEARVFACRTAAMSLVRALCEKIGPSRQRDAQNESPAFVGVADSNNKGGRRVTTYLNVRQC